LLVLEKSGKSPGISCGLESGHPVSSMLLEANAKWVLLLVPTIVLLLEVEPNDASNV